MKKQHQDKAMKTSPLQLNYHFFPDIKVTANNDISLHELENEDIDFDLNYEANIFEHKNNPLEFRIELQIDVTPVENKVCTYEVSLRCIGFFDISEDISEEKRKSIVYINGASMLYSASREYILFVTSRGPYPPIYLPSVSFKDEGNKE